MTGLGAALAQTPTPRAHGWAAEALTSLRGDGCAVLGGDNRALTPNDTTTNNAAAAAELGLLNPQSVADIGGVLGGGVSRVAALTPPRVALPTLGGTQCVRPAGWLAASSLGAGGVGLVVSLPARQATACLGFGGAGKAPRTSIVELSAGPVGCQPAAPYVGPRLPGRDPVGLLARVPYSAVVGGVVVGLTPTSPVAVSSSLEAASEVVPTRVGGVDAGDPLQVNARGAGVPALAAAGYSMAELGRWAQS